MQTVLCAYGEGISPRRTGPVRTIDAAPTVAEWLGMPAPRDARGRSVLSELLGR
jgi:arylsulfatase A-like enzyme